MGRTNTRNLNVPPGMIPRKQRSGKTYYYLRLAGTPRREIPLGDDFILALRKYAEHNTVEVPSAAATFADVAKKYQTEALPLLKPNTIKMHRSDLKHLLASFAAAPLDQIKPMHIKKLLAKHKATPTTANRCKRLFSTMWNHARGWGYTDLPNPCAGIKGFALDKRTNYITDELFKAVHGCASVALRDAMDLAYLTGQRPADVLRMSEHDILAGHLIITQGKTKQPLRIVVAGELADLLARIKVRKTGHKIVSSALLVNLHGKRLTPAVLRNHFDDARTAAAEKHPALADSIKAFHFYDLRAKAADDTSDERGDQAASDLLGHDSVRTTQRHYLRRGKIVGATK